MRCTKKSVYSITLTLCLIILITTTQSVIKSSQDAVTICIYTVIPSLLPFIVITNLLSDHLTNGNLPLLRHIGRFCKIPSGSEPLLLLGFLSGYPIGAKNVFDTYQRGALSKEDAQRMIAFCNNAGPSFLFGILGGLFSNKLVIPVLWIIHILSALLVGRLLPGSCSTIKKEQRHRRPISVTDVILNTVKALGSICVWIILFKVCMDSIMQQQIIQLPKYILIMLSGVLELTNGCISLYTLSSEGQRFVTAALFLSFGGLCIVMQTVSVTKGLAGDLYIAGKLLQSFFSLLFAGMLQYVLFDPGQHWHIPMGLMIIHAIVSAGAFLYLYKKKTVAFLHKMRYNTKKDPVRCSYVIQEKDSALL